MTVQTGGPPQAIPEPPSGRGLRLLLGRPLRNDEELAERLSNPMALAILSSDALSSVAYAGEEALKVLLPVAGAAAFDRLPPISFLVALLLSTLVFSYRQTIKAYPNAGGAYVVTRDNFGLLAAQVAGVSLMLDYVMTVAVSTAAGVAAIYSVAPGLFVVKVPIALAFIWLVAWGNLRGVRTTGKLFAAPTYLFVVSVAGLIVVGLARMATGGLHRLPDAGHLPPGTEAVGLFVLAHAYASGTTALTGVEAISNGVPLFRPPEWRNARRVLSAMGALLATLFVGLSLLAWKLHPVPTEKQTLASRLGQAVFGTSGAGRVAFLVLQAATTVILVLAANTSFADFPRLASFAAEDGYVPVPLRRRGRRLSFSFGIMALAVLASAVTLATGADVHRLIPLYAVGVFTSFTFSQAGMTRRHLRLREEGWRRSLAINAVGALGSGVTLVAIVATKFSAGAWLVIVIVPIGVGLLLSIHRHYERAAARLADPGPDGFESPSELETVVLAGQGARAAYRQARQRTGAGRLVLVTVPFTAAGGPLARLGRRTRLAWLTARLRRLPDVALGWVPDGVASPRPFPAQDGACTTIVSVPEADLRARRGLAVGRLFGCQEIRAVHVDLDRRQTDRLVDVWPEHDFGTELEVVAAPYRESAGPLAWVTARLRGQHREVVVVVPEVAPRWWQVPLYDREARPITEAVLAQGATLVVELPFPL